VRKSNLETKNQYKYNSEKEMKTQTLGFIAILLTAISLFAQQPDTLWTRTFGGVGLDIGWKVLQTEDGGYAILGLTNSFGAGGYDIYLIKTDANGDTEWTKTYGGNLDEIAGGIQQTSDGGFIISGSTGSFNAIIIDIYLIKTDANGDTLWTRMFSLDDDDNGTDVRQTADGGYILTGFSSSTGSAGGYDMILLKTDAVGNLLWTRFFGGDASDYSYSVRQTTDGGYIIAGESGSVTLYDYDAYIIKTDSDGDTLWTRNYGGFLWDEFTCIRETPDTGYIAVGSSYSFSNGCNDAYLVKINSGGDTLWTKIYGADGDDAGLNVSLANDGGYIIAGTTRIFEAIWNDAYLIRTDDVGDTLWTFIYRDEVDEIWNNAIQTNDGGYIVVGETNSFGAGDYDIWLVSLNADSLGIENHRDEISLEYILHKPYPNPFNQTTNIVFELPEPENIALSIYDVSGREVGRIFRGLLSAGIHHCAYDASDLTSGIYFIRRTSDKTQQIQKLLLLK
jgi:hypothetical protein